MASRIPLILIDVQKGFDDRPYWGGNRNNPAMEANVARLLRAWREAGQPVIHVRHDSVLPQSPLRLGQAGNKFKPEAQPLSEEPIFAKTVNSALIGTTLEPYLRERGYPTLVIAGLTTDHCVSTTVRMAANLGFTVYVAEDACATFDKELWGQRIPAEEVHRVHLASLNGEFATLTSTERLLRNFLQDGRLAVD